MANKIVFYTGMVLIIVAAILLAGNFLGSTSPIVLGILGIVAIGASKYRPMKSVKKKR